MPKPANPQQKKKNSPSLFSLLRPYKGIIITLVVLALLSNALNLIIPLLISRSIDAYILGTFDLTVVAWEFILVAAGIFIFTFFQSIVQVRASEKVARDLRNEVSRKISEQSFAAIQAANPSKLLTNLTADVDSIKMFISQAIVNLISSAVIILGTTIMLLLLNWQLALVVLLMIPLIGGVFFVIFAKVRVLFIKTREIIDWLNKVINESILGAGLIRVLNANYYENQKFLDANSNARNVGLQILALFAAMIPTVTFIANTANLAILLLGGWFVIGGSMTLGEFAAFNNYVVLLIFPILILGFISNLISQASASYTRIRDILEMPDLRTPGLRRETLQGNIAVEHLSLQYGEKAALKDVSFTVKPGTKTAIIGPTAAGKTQLLYALTGLITTTGGSIHYDGHPLEDYDPETLHQQLGFVFQDSIMFNMSIRENIAFNTSVSEEALEKAIQAAELSDFITTLPEGLNTIVSERGTSLSGGQKQRIMLARALALNPKILLLDDFTARVDINTEKKILDNVARLYPELTLISVTQKIGSVTHYDNILLLMEGELLAQGTHTQLLHDSPEYAQIYQSQRSTNELHAE